MLNRREVLGVGTTATMVSLLDLSTARSDADEYAKLQIIDTNVSLFHWPFRRLPLNSTKALVKKMRSLGISQAWAGSFEGVLHRDIASVNQRLSQECRQFPELVPIGSINPTLPDWEDDVRRCVDEHKMPGIRLHPNYHDYQLNDARFVRLLQLAAKAGPLVQLAAAMEDARTQHPKVRVADVDLSKLPNAMKQADGVRVQILNYRPRSGTIEELGKTPGLFFDTARVGSTDGVPNLVKRVRIGRVLFGTHAPFLIPEASLIRTHESGQLDLDALQAVLAGNAVNLIKKPNA